MKEPNPPTRWHPESGVKVTGGVRGSCGSADAPGPDPTAVAAGVAGLLPAVAHRPVVPQELRRLPGSVTWTTRLRKDAALHGLPGPRTGKRGRPRVKGTRLPKLAVLAGQAAVFAPVTVRRYGKTAAVHAAALTCLRHGVFGARPVQVVLVRDRTACEPTPPEIHAIRLAWEGSAA